MFFLPLADTPFIPVHRTGFSGVILIKISRKEAKESGYWIELIEPKEEQLMEKQNLIKEATELTKIFGSIVEKSK